MVRQVLTLENWSSSPYFEEDKTDPHIPDTSVMMTGRKIRARFDKAQARDVIKKHK
jgi:Tfp pilus assembly protein PilP